MTGVSIFIRIGRHALQLPEVVLADFMTKIAYGTRFHVLIFRLIPNMSFHTVVAYIVYSTPIAGESDTSNVTCRNSYMSWSEIRHFLNMSTSMYVAILHIQRGVCYFFVTVCEILQYKGMQLKSIPVLAPIGHLEFHHSMWKCFPSV